MTIYCSRWQRGLLWARITSKSLWCTLPPSQWLLSVKTWGWGSCRGSCYWFWWWRAWSRVPWRHRWRRWGWCSWLYARRCWLRLLALIRCDITSCPTASPPRPIPYCPGLKKSRGRQYPHKFPARIEVSWWCSYDIFAWYLLPSYTSNRTVANHHCTALLSIPSLLTSAGSCFSACIISTCCYPGVLVSNSPSCCATLHWSIETIVNDRSWLFQVESFCPLSWRIVWHRCVRSSQQGWPERTLSQEG